MFEHILVTGGAGFVGAALAIAFKKQYPQTAVTAFDNLHRRGSELNLSRLREAGVEFSHGDVRSSEDLKSLANPPDLILECSAEPSAQAGYGGSPEYLINTNLLGCFNCLELARRHNSAVVFISTSRVYPYRRLKMTCASLKMPLATRYRRIRIFQARRPSELQRRFRWTVPDRSTA